jgi:DnaJ homolog subfamily C member 10
VGGIVKFGSVDCSVHRDLCSTYNIRAYPTLVFYNQSVPHTYSGQFAARDIASYVEDILRPPGTLTQFSKLIQFLPFFNIIVVELTIDNFDLLVSYRPTGEIWLIDFFASWCGPCIQLAPQWRRFARMLSVLNNVHVGSVDCVTQELLCSQHHVGSYPTIRLYPVGTGAQYM